ncbi:MAG: hypothetical protein FWD61_11620 [Phycisphaerales bacterium]|nr:hypothetical protein [Phycisphaerales bacterium]
MMLACQAAGIARATAYVYREEDIDFSQAWDLALEDAADVLELEAWRRGKEGVKRYLYHAGEPVLNEAGEHIYELEYSDGILQLLLKAARPAKYRENHKITHEGAVGIRTTADGETQADRLLDQIRELAGEEVAGGDTAGGGGAAGVVSDRAVRVKGKS